MHPPLGFLKERDYIAAVMRAVSGGLIISLWLAVATSGQAGEGTWQTLAPMPAARQELASAVLNGKIYVMAGYDENGNSTDSVFVYNPATDTWASAHPLPSLNNHNNAAVAAGKLYSFGGRSLTTYLYDPLNDSWAPVATLNLGRGDTAAVGVINDKIYVAGGDPAGNALEVFNPATNTWTILAPMSVARNHCGGGVINGKFYVVGGRGAAGAPTALEAYDPQTNTWSVRAPMPTGRSGIGVGAVNGELYVFGGEIPTLHPEVEVYNPGSNSWRSLPNMPAPRHGIWASVIGNKIYLPGGGGVQGFGASDHNDVFIIPGPSSPATFANISTRLKVETGDNALIGGFIVTGTAAKRVILRAIGPSLTVPGALANPRLELYNGAGQSVAANDNWQDAPNRQEIIDSALQPSHDLESAILTSVAPGNHTAIVRGVNDSVGVALVEVYDLEAGAGSRLGNISTRGFVQTGDNVLIGGVILAGQDARRVIVRAIGPSLPLSGALADPTLELRDASGTLLDSNDNWRTTQETEIIGTGLPPSHNSESAIVRTLPPAQYTAIVRGQNAATGIALVEAYALD